MQTIKDGGMAMKLWRVSNDKEETDVKVNLDNYAYPEDISKLGKATNGDEFATCLVGYDIFLLYVHLIYLLKFLKPPPCSFEYKQS